MQLLRGNPDFAALTKLAAVRETGGRVDVYRRAVYAKGKLAASRLVLAHDTIAVLGGVLGNMLDCLVHVRNYLDRKDIIQKFRIEIVGTRLYAAEDCKRFFIAAELYARFASRRTLVAQPRF